MHRYNRVPLKNEKDVRLVLEIDSVLDEVNEYLWSWQERFIWIGRKLQFTPSMLTKTDMAHIRLGLDKIPNIELLIQCRNRINVQLRESKANKVRAVLLDRAIFNVRSRKSFLTRLLAEVSRRVTPDSTITSPHKVPQVKNIPLKEVRKFTEEVISQYDLSPLKK